MRFPFHQQTLWLSPAKCIFWEEQKILILSDLHLGKSGHFRKSGVAIPQNIFKKDLQTFVKSMGSIGAFIAGPKDVINYLRYNVRSQIYAKSLPIAIVDGMLTRMEMLKNMPELREKLWHIVNRLQNGLREKGFDIGATNSPVTPIYMKGGLPEATNMVMDIRENYNIFCSVVVYPVIPKGEIIFRIIPTAAHTDEDVNLTLKAFEETKKKLDNGDYKAEEIPDMSEAGYLQKTVA